MGDPLDRAKHDLAQLEDQIALHDDAVRRHEFAKNNTMIAAEEVRTFIRLFERYSVDDSMRVLDEAVKTATPFTIAERVARIGAEVIRNAGHRTSTETICQAVLSAGVPIGGKDDAAKRNNVSGILSRDKDSFHGIRHRGWWLRALGPCPDDPSQNTETADHDLEGADSAASAEPRPTSEGTP